jgi:molybdopterin converting factor small subunit
MAVEVRIPTILRKYSDGEKTVKADGATIRDLIAGLDARYPGLGGQLLTEDGSLHRFVNVYLNDEDIRFLGTLDATLGEGDVVAILPAVAGGSGGLKERNEAWATGVSRRHSRGRPACGAVGGSPPVDRG